MTEDRMIEVSWVRIPLAAFRDFGKLIYPILPVSFRRGIGVFYLVSMPGEVKDPTRGVNV